VSSSPTVAITISSAGFAVSGLTTSPVLGIFFTEKGFSIYNPSVGLGAVVAFPYANYASYPQVFDMMRITKVDIEAYAGLTVATANQATAIPVFYTCVDYDLNNSPATAAQVLSYDNSKVRQANTMGTPFMKETFVPRLLQPVSGATNTIMPPGTWIDVTDTITPHYGAFLAIDTMQSAANGNVALIATVHYEWAANH
jgi:hypothetical protein